MNEQLTPCDICGKDITEMYNCIECGANMCTWCWINGKLGYCEACYEENKL
jgi:hypothetical protein